MRMRRPVGECTIGPSSGIRALHPMCLPSEIAAPGGCGGVRPQALSTARIARSRMRCTSGAQGRKITLEDTEAVLDFTRTQTPESGGQLLDPQIAAPVIQAQQARAFCCASVEVHSLRLKPKVRSDPSRYVVGGQDTDAVDSSNLPNDDVMQVRKRLAARNLGPARLQIPFAFGQHTAGDPVLVPMPLPVRRHAKPSVPDRICEGEVAEEPGFLIGGVAVLEDVRVDDVIVRGRLTARTGSAPPRRGASFPSGRSAPHENPTPARRSAPPLPRGTRRPACPAPARCGCGPCSSSSPGGRRSRRCCSLRQAGERPPSGAR